MPGTPFGSNLLLIQVVVTELSFTLFKCLGPELQTFVANEREQLQYAAFKLLDNEDSQVRFDVAKYPELWLNMQLFEAKYRDKLEDVKALLSQKVPILHIVGSATMKVGRRIRRDPVILLLIVPLVILSLDIVNYQSFTILKWMSLFLYLYSLGSLGHDAFKGAFEDDSLSLKELRRESRSFRSFAKSFFYFSPFSLSPSKIDEKFGLSLARNDISGTRATFSAVFNRYFWSGSTEALHKGLFQKWLLSGDSISKANERVELTPQMQSLVFAKPSEEVLIEAIHHHKDSLYHGIILYRHNETLAKKYMSSNLLEKIENRLQDDCALCWNDVNGLAHVSGCGDVAHHHCCYQNSQINHRCLRCNEKCFQME